MNSVSDMEGDKVFLRALEPTDAEILQSWNFDAVTSRYFSPRLPVSSDEQQQWFLAQSGSDRKKLIICDKKSKHAVGIISLMRIDHIHKNAETGITIGDKSYLGKGYASEALTLLLGFAFHSWNMQRVYAKVMDKNKAACRFYTKNDFVQEGIERKAIFHENSYHDIHCFSILKEEFNKTNPKNL